MSETLRKPITPLHIKNVFHKNIPIVISYNDDTPEESAYSDFLETHENSVGVFVDTDYYANSESHIEKLWNLVNVQKTVNGVKEWELPDGHTFVSIDPKRVAKFIGVDCPSEITDEYIELLTDHFTEEMICNDQLDECECLKMALEIHGIKYKSGTIKGSSQNEVWTVILVIPEFIKLNLKTEEAQDKYLNTSYQELSLILRGNVYDYQVGNEVVLTGHVTDNEEQIPMSVLEDAEEIANRKKKNAVFTVVSGKSNIHCKSWVEAEAISDAMGGQKNNTIKEIKQKETEQREID